MRSRSVAAPLAVAVIGVAAVAIDVNASALPEPQPNGIIYRHEQTPGGVDVILHNPSKQWTLRGQRVVIVLFHADGLPIRSYGPSGRFHRSISDPLGKSRPDDFIECCYLPDLGPGETYVFKTWRIVDLRVGRVNVRPWDNPPEWERTG